MRVSAYQTPPSEYSPSVSDLPERLTLPFHHMSLIRLRRLPFSRLEYSVHLSHPHVGPFARWSKARHDHDQDQSKRIPTPIYAATSILAWTHQADGESSLPPMKTTLCRKFHPSTKMLLIRHRSSCHWPKRPHSHKLCPANEIIASDVRESLYFATKVAALPFVFVARPSFTTEVSSIPLAAMLMTKGALSALEIVLGAGGRSDVGFMVRRRTIRVAYWWQRPIPRKSATAWRAILIVKSSLGKLLL